MFEKNFVFLCCGLFFFITLSKSQQNSTNNEKNGDNLMVKFEVDMDSTTKYSDEIKSLQYDLYEKLSNNTTHEMQNKYRIISTKNDHMDVDLILYELNKRFVHNPEDDDNIPINYHSNSTKGNHKKNITSQEVSENLYKKIYSTSNETFEDSNKINNESNIVPYEMCHNITCILLCCPLGNRMSMPNYKCISEDNKYIFPNVSKNMNDSMQSENKEVDELYQLAVYDSCRNTERFLANEGYQYDYKIYANGSIYLSAYKLLFKSTSYCLGIFMERGDMYEVTFCSETAEQFTRNAAKYIPEIRSELRTYKIYACLHIVCIFFYMAVILAYSILPELRNVHGFMLRHYTATSSIVLVVYIARTMHYKVEMPHSVCITVAFLQYFSVMSTLFWLGAMSFNMWRTFRAFSSLQKSVRQSEKRKLVYYTIFSYGCPFILGIVCVVIVDFISDYLPIYIRPGFEMGNCFYYGTGPSLLYFYVIKCVCAIISVWLSISAALKIKRYENDTNFRLTDSESKRYNFNKKWFNQYMQLFIVMFIVIGLNLIMFTTSWMVGILMKYYVLYISAFLDIVQAFCTFIIFVWKKKIKLMLLKRFGFESERTSST